MQADVAGQGALSRCGLDAPVVRAERIGMETTAKEARMAQARLAFLAMAALTALSACGGGVPMTPAPSQPAPQVLPPAAPKDRLIAAIEAQNCVLTAQNVESILLDAGLTQSELVALTPELAAEGRAEVAAEGTIRVLSQNCI
jgi:hypothetical protein